MLRCNNFGRYGVLHRATSSKALLQGELSTCPGRILPVPCEPGEYQAHLTHVTAYCAKDKYSTRTSSPLFSSFRNSLTHLLEKPSGISVFHGLCAVTGTLVSASRDRPAAGRAALPSRPGLSRSGKEDLARLRFALLSAELQRWEVPFPWLQEDQGRPAAAPNPGSSPPWQTRPRKPPSSGYSRPLTRVAGTRLGLITPSSPAVFKGI